MLPRLRRQQLLSNVSSSIAGWYPVTRALMRMLGVVEAEGGILPAWPHVMKSPADWPETSFDNLPYWLLPRTAPKRG